MRDRPAADGDLAARAARLIERGRWGIVVGMAVLVGLAGWRASRLELHTNLAELLPTDHPAVKTLDEADRRLASVSSLTVVVQGPSPRANRAFVDALVPRLRGLRLPVIEAVQEGVAEESAFFRREKFLYASSAELEQAYRRLRDEIARRKNPLYVELEPGEGKGLAGGLREIEKKERELLGKWPDGYFASRDRRLYAVVVWLRSSLFGDRAGTEAAAAIHGVTERLLAERHDPRLEVGLTGNVIASDLERAALEKDLVWATAICVTLVCLSIFLFYGRASSVPLAALPALCGVTLALGFAQLAFHYLNSSTAFMGSIIVGNGINYAIILMARYEEERRLGRAVRGAVAVALRTTWRPTAAASAAAAVSYGSLAITSFRGFSQFGVIGGVGMLVSWLVTVLLLPALWFITDRRAAGQTVPRLRGFAAGAPLGRLAERRPGLLAGLALVLTLGALVPLPRYARDPFEYDFDKLRSRATRGSEQERLSGLLIPLFGRSLSPSFILADRRGDVEEIRRRLWDNDRGKRVLGAVRTVYDFLPGAPDEQQRKLAVLTRIRGLVDRNRDLLGGEDRAALERYRPPDGLHVLTPRDLPGSLRRPFTEKDGTVGRVLAFFTRDDIAVWDGRTQLKLAATVEKVRLHDGRTVRSSGWPVIFAAMIQAITHDGPIVTAASFLGVVALVVVFAAGRARRARWGGGASGVALTLTALVAGVLWMVGAAATAHVRINFLNFIALPITFGIGVDYSLNLFLRYRLEGRGRVGPAVAATGAAVALCSLTTIIGYAALLSSDNNGLRSFGALAILGEFACLAAALLLLPALLRLRELRAARREAGGAEESPLADGASTEGRHVRDLRVSGR